MIGDSVELISECFTAPTGMVVLTAKEHDIRRGYLIGPDGQRFRLSPKNQPGYQFTYRPVAKEGGWPETEEPACG